MRLAFLLVLGLLGTAAWMFLANAAPCYERPSTETGVWIEGKGGNYTLYRNGQPFLIKGASGHGHFRELAQAGGNTLRVYDTLALGQQLDSAQRYGLALIVDLSIPHSRFANFYEDEAKTGALQDALLRTVREHKDHPALLYWNLGNEVDFPLEPGNRAFYTFYNSMLRQLKALDTQHPFSTAMTTFQRRYLLAVNFRTRDLDMLGFNAFGQIKNLESRLENAAWFWRGPYLLTEWGVNGYWENGFSSWRAPLELTSAYKIFQVSEQYQQAMPHGNPRFLGSCFFYWGSHHEYTPTWFGVFDQSGSATPLYATLAALWQGEQVPLPPLPIEGVSVNGQYPNADAFATPGQEMRAELTFYQPQDSTLSISWELRPEDWYSGHWPYGPENEAVFSLERNHRTIRFVAPTVEGPYRLYAKVTDAQGVVSTASSPFYLVH